MIPLEKQVTPLNLSEQLKELGVEQDSLYVWHVVNHQKPYPHWIDEKNKEEIKLFEGKEAREGLNLHNQHIKVGRIYNFSIDLYAAFTVAELGEMLPDGYHSGRMDDVWYCEDVYVTKAETEADARAKMLIYLIKNKYMEANE